MTLIPLCIFLYSMIAGVSFRAIANATNHPDDPWRSPGPFFGALAWPVALPLLLGIKGGTLVLGDGERLSRDERRRDKELTEARHKQELARIEAETTRELERALKR